MKIFKKIFAFFLVIVMVSASVSMSVFFNSFVSQWLGIKASATSENKCGDNLFWHFDYSTGELAITGIGTMDDYGAYFDLPPWSELSDSIKTVVIGNGVTSVGIWAFNDCCLIEKITIGSSVKNIGKFAFDLCAELTEIIVDENNQYFTNDENGVLYNKEKTELVKYPIGNERNNFVIPDSVVTIGDYAFRDCITLTSITIPDSVVAIGEAAFIQCENLKNAKMSNNVGIIGAEAFNSCVNLENITIPEKVSEIKTGTFACCKSLTDIVIPDSVTEIGFGAFLACENLASVTIGPKVTVISDYAFDYCTSLKNVYYLGTQTLWNEISIGSDNAYLETAIICSKKIVDSGKCGDSLLWEFCADDTLVITGTGEMYDYEHGNRPWEGYKNSIKSVIVGNDVTVIGAFAFYDCDSVTNITMIGNSVTKLQILNSKLELTADMTEKLVLSISEAHPDFLSIVWKTSDSSVAVVDENGVVTAVDTGVATITAEMPDGQKAVCDITVISSDDEACFEANPESTCVIKDNFIYGLKPQLTMSELLSKYLSFIGVTVDVKLYLGRYLGTGSTVTVIYPNGTEEIYTIIIYGDYDGNGLINQTDVSRLSMFFSAGGEMTDAQKKAMNIDGDQRGRITTSDLREFRSKLNSDIPINQGNLVL